MTLKRSLPVTQTSVSRSADSFQIRRILISSVSLFDGERVELMTARICPATQMHQIE
jgi:hypothetical protein